MTPIQEKDHIINRIWDQVELDVAKKILMITAFTEARQATISNITSPLEDLIWEQIKENIKTELATHMPLSPTGENR